MAMTDEAPEAVSEELLQALASSLVWRIGRANGDGPVVVRVGMAGATAAFAEAPRLHAASEAELRAAIEANDVRVEWIGGKIR